MKRPLIYYPTFRIFSPPVTGILVYLMILLINNQVSQLGNYFVSQELYVCIGLAFIIQESLGIFLYFSKRVPLRKKHGLLWTIQIIGSLFLTVVIVTACMWAYYEWILEFSPNVEELAVFNGVFGYVSLVYVSLYVSHQFLRKLNSEKIKNVKFQNQEITEKYQQFRQGIHTTLLFESLESLIVLMKEDQEKGQDFMRTLSAVYRYLLSTRKGELVSFQEEQAILQKWICLLNYLPYRNIELMVEGEVQTWIVPGTLITIMECIAKSTILAKASNISISIVQQHEQLLISYPMQERLTQSFHIHQLSNIQRKYALYSEHSITIYEKAKIKTIRLPILISEKVAV